MTRWIAGAAVAAMMGLFAAAPASAAQPVSDTRAVTQQNTASDWAVSDQRRHYRGHRYYGHRRHWAPRRHYGYRYYRPYRPYSYSPYYAYPQPYYRPYYRPAPFFPFF